MLFNPNWKPAETETITEQSLFDQVVKHLATQRKVSRNETTLLCVYRGPHGLKCAVGALISDDEYRPEMERGGTVHAVAEKNLLPARLMPHVDFLRALQKLHDKESVSSWPAALRGVAREYSLSEAAITEFFYEHRAPCDGLKVGGV